MSIILASIYEKQHHRGTVLNIATGAMPVPRLAFLVPGWKIVLDHQRGIISDQQYIDGYLDRETGQRIPGYREILQARWPAVARWLKELDPQQDLTLVCFCPEYKQHRRKFCHRQYLYKVLVRFRPDIPVILH